MAGFGNEVQRMVSEALKGDSELLSLLTGKGVYDDKPQPGDAGDPSIYPYVTIGEDINTAWDTDDTTGADNSITIHTWSRAKGYKETKTIQGVIYDILNRAELGTSEYAFVTCEFLQHTAIMDSDGETRHGISTFRILLDQL
jgi:hypothetical protein